jgi:hypothetical protein
MWITPSGNTFIDKLCSLPTSFFRTVADQLCRAWIATSERDDKSVWEEVFEHANLTCKAPATVAQQDFVIWRFVDLVISRFGDLLIG